MQIPMNAMKPFAAALSVLALAAPGISAAQSANDWKYEASVYLFLSDVSGRVVFPPTGASKEATVDIGDILSDLKMGFMGSFEARRGPWGVFTDIAYMDVGNVKENSTALSIGRVGIPADVNANLSFDLKLWAWALLGEYALVADPDFRLDLLAGTRVLDVRPKVDYTLTGNVGPIALPDRSGQARSQGAELGRARRHQGPRQLRAGRWMVRAVLLRHRHRRIEAHLPGDGGRRLRLRMGRRGRVMALPRLPDEVRKADRGTELQRPAGRRPVSLVR